MRGGLVPGNRQNPNNTGSAGTHPSNAPAAHTAVAVSATLSGSPFHSILESGYDTPHSTPHDDPSLTPSQIGRLRNATRSRRRAFTPGSRRIFDVTHSPSGTSKPRSNPRVPSGANPASHTGASTPHARGTTMIDTVGTPIGTLPSRM